MYSSLARRPALSSASQAASKASGRSPCSSIEMGSISAPKLRRLSRLAMKEYSSISTTSPRSSSISNTKSTLDMEPAPMARSHAGAGGACSVWTCCRSQSRRGCHAKGAYLCARLASLGFSSTFVPSTSSTDKDLIGKVLSGGTPWQRTLTSGSRIRGSRCTKGFSGSFLQRSENRLSQQRLRLEFPFVWPDAITCRANAELLAPLSAGERLRRALPRQEAMRAPTHGHPK
mmetsp:Transcript_44354/g.96378  ORF Transcript_44354/g.96378 Transcript_44354/m.96378 type:complete len:231 (-) Transcript_44354:8-700(-)